VIGKRGATAQSLRNLLRALGAKNDARYNLKIINNGVGPSHGMRDDHTSPTASDDATNDNDANTDVTTVSFDHAPEAKAEPEAHIEEDHSSSLSKTRKELEELDDLDV